MTLGLSLQSARPFAVARLHGHSRIRIIAATIRRGAAPGVAIGLPVITIALVALKLINDWNEISRFFLLTTGVTLVLLIVTIISLFVGVNLATSRSIRNSLAGRTDTLPTLTALTVMNIVTVMTAITVLISLLLLSSKVQRFSQQISENMQGITYMTLSGSTNSAKNLMKLISFLAKSCENRTSTGVFY
ncbi:hypothetical protein [Dermatophilus congolensis]|uniref:hypothetical protein n=1 Tax=Dermatophilus congolensis TaxID=1863 RepID=UPI001AAFEA6A|nr:hypothetical protein [Dermatophilus congolensis]MBO3128492.1 hypothetical protein [Dermatophilus congolensis]MBO3132971.1 hypothetical protein [Dermatophilus congolensis]MBO3135208.1 hypothetical protein [Dermatophilus congolensis]MBO3137444.1 hypothetical protein [Dermatophilus congolensis]MBO3139686.1 hypothetical protein [Dermatophilus congolensis]